jgi:molybdate transport system ATP-binding protein
MTGGLAARLEARVGDLTIDVAFDTGPGALVVIGPNGAGKSSLLLLVLGALRAKAGRVTVGTTPLFDSTTRLDVPLERRGLAYVPQDYALLPHLSVRGNVEFALGSAPVPWSLNERHERSRAALAEVSLDALEARFPDTLSGGEKQRVALARALSINPRALLLDEPLAALDVHARREVRDFLARTLARLGLPALIVTHDAADARRLGQRVAVMEAGRFTQVGTWDELAAKPASHFVEEFVATASAPTG